MALNLTGFKAGSCLDTVKIHIRVFSTTSFTMLLGVNRATVYKIIKIVKALLPIDIDYRNNNGSNFKYIPGAKHDGHRLANDIVKFIFLNATFCILIQVLLHFILYTSLPEQNGRLFGRRHFQMIFLEWKFRLGAE